MDEDRKATVGRREAAPWRGPPSWVSGKCSQEPSGQPLVPGVAHSPAQRPRQRSAPRVRLAGAALVRRPAPAGRQQGRPEAPQPRVLLEEHHHDAHVVGAAAQPLEVWRQAGVAHLLANVLETLPSLEPLAHKVHSLRQRERAAGRLCHTGKWRCQPRQRKACSTYPPLLSVDAWPRPAVGLQEDAAPPPRPERVQRRQNPGTPARARSSRPRPPNRAHPAASWGPGVAPPPGWSARPRCRRRQG